MTEYSFFIKNAGGGKTWLLCGRNLNICPLLHWLQLPCHSQAELFSISSLKVWGDVQKPHHDIGYLLVSVENIMGDRHYGISILWVNSNQVRAASMEEAGERLTGCTSSGTNWPYALANCTRTLAMCHSLRMGTWASYLREGQRRPQPNQGPPTPCCQSPSCLLHRFEWAWWAHYNHPSRPSGQQCKPYCKWIYLLGDGYPFTPSGGTGPKDTAIWWGLHYPVSQSTQISPRIRRQYDYGGQQPPIPSSAGSI